MAVRLEHINIIVRIDAIREKTPGGLERVLSEHEQLIGYVRWFDEHLLRDGAMNGSDANGLVGYWRARGLEPTVTREDGETVWNDLCVLGVLGGSRHPCEWLARMPGEVAVHRAGTDPGPVIGRAEMGVVSDDGYELPGVPRWKRYPNWPIGFDPDAASEPEPEPERDDESGWGSF